MSSSELQKFGIKLRTLRKKQGFTLQALASQFGWCTHSYLSELEAGKKIPTALFILHASRLFGVSTEVLMKDEIDLESSQASE